MTLSIARQASRLFTTTTATAAALPLTYVKGTLYGITGLGGAYGFGTIVSITP